MKFLIALFILMASTKSFAANVCDNVQNLSNLWNTKYQQIVQSDSGFADGSPSFKITQALCMLENVFVGNTSFYAGLFSKFVSLALIDLTTASPDFAQTIAGQTNIRILSSYFNSKPIFEYKRASVLVHEARHIQLDLKNSSSSAHVICQRGSVVGTYNCDQTFIPNWKDGAAYSYEVMFFRKLYEDNTLNLKKSDIKIWLKYMLDNSFNEVSQADYAAFLGEAPISK